jgi:hypothetical protein
MKTMRLFLVLFASGALCAGLSAQTISNYGVVKTHYMVQNSSSAPADDSYNPYGLSAYVFGTGLAGTYSFTTPGGSAISPQTLAPNGGGYQFNSDSTPFASASALNLAYFDGAYSMALPNNSGIGPQSANLPSYTPDNYPGAPTIGGIWSGGKLLIDPTQNYTLTFTSFSGFSSSNPRADSIAMNINGVGTNYFSNTPVTSFLIAANTLTSGSTYDASLRFNLNYSDYAVNITGATGNFSFTTEVAFQIQAIPEPSTYAEIFGVVALTGVMFQRRRRQV